MDTYINNFVIRFANVNGTGSSSANGIIAKCIYRMGLDIGPKNMFPSNIQGMPTWYEVRVSSCGKTGRRGSVDLMIAMNRTTLIQDADSLSQEGYFLYDNSRELKLESLHDNKKLPIPISKLAREQFKQTRSTILLQNMIYVGALIPLLNLDYQIIHDLISEQYQQKPQLIPLNLDALHLGLTYAEKNFNCPLPFSLDPKKLLDAKRNDKHKDKILMSGNTALALGSVVAGATVCSWYPLTPSTSVVESFSKYCSRYRMNKTTNKKKYAIVQAEDEISAIGMVLGATWNGARAFTATSGPGISLMSEFIGYAYYAEIPAVIFNIQRCGPSTGMPTRTQQADLLLCAYASHGDTSHIMLFPKDPYECFEFSIEAYDLAEYYQTPVFIMSDLELGMNEYLSKPLTKDQSYKPQRGKIWGAKQLDTLTEPFYRYLDIDQDGIPYRTLPGVHKKGAYFTRGSGHDRFGKYTEDPEKYKDNMLRIKKKFETFKQSIDRPFIHSYGETKAPTCIVYFGSTHEALNEALEILWSRSGRKIDTIRIRSFPFGAKLNDALDTYDKIVVVEQNRDGQMRHLLVTELNINSQKMSSICIFDGLPLEANKLSEMILES